MVKHWRAVAVGVAITAAGLASMAVTAQSSPHPRSLRAAPASARIELDHGCQNPEPVKFGGTYWVSTNLVPASWIPRPVRVTTEEKRTPPVSYSGSVRYTSPNELVWTRAGTSLTFDRDDDGDFFPDCLQKVP